MLAEIFDEKRFLEETDGPAGCHGIRFGGEQQDPHVRVFSAEGFRQLAAPGKRQIEVENEKVQVFRGALDEEIAAGRFAGSENDLVVQRGQLTPNQPGETGKISDQKDGWAFLGGVIGNWRRDCGKWVLHGTSQIESRPYREGYLRILANTGLDLVRIRGAGKCINKYEFNQ